MSNDKNLFEHILFTKRIWVIAAFVLTTLFFLSQALQLKFDSNLKKMVPLSHEYIQNLLKHKDELGLGNDVQIAISVKSGDIFDEEYLDVVRQITDELYDIEGTDPSNIKSLWTPNMRWTAVTVEGFEGGEIIPPEYDGSEESLEQVRTNVLRSAEVGRTVADNFKSSIIYVPLVEADENGEGGVDYREFPKQLEDIRKRYENDKYSIHIVGFAKKIGDLIDGIAQIFVFAAITLILTAALLAFDTRCLYSTLAVIVCSVTAVIWQLGIINLLRKYVAELRAGDVWYSWVEKYPGLDGIQFDLDPYAVLVPFLVFAIGVSHGVQIVNACANNVADGDSKLDAGRNAFRALYKPGLIALVSDAIGFITLMFIEVGVIRELAISASIGVAVIILTNLLLAPIIMSYSGVSSACQRNISNKRGNQQGGLWSAIAAFSKKPLSVYAVAVALVLYVVGWGISTGLKIGDLDKGAPELWPDSQYNQDIEFITSNYSVSADVLIVMVETPPEGCNSYEALKAMERLEWNMRNTEGVQSALSISTAVKKVNAAMNEGSLKWYEVSRDQYAVNNAMRSVPNSLFNLDCTLAPVFIFLDDHKAETLSRVTEEIESFAKEVNTDDGIRFILASGNAGIEAATNQTIEASQTKMLILVYSVVIFLCLLAFRSVKAVVCIIFPLVLTSILCQALMAMLGIGVKVATLPVIALGVGIGVDYGIYIFSKFDSYLKQGLSITNAYEATLRSTGKAVALTGLALAIGVFTWAFSPIKFQADMGILLTFMFLWNMIGALLLIPAMARLLLKDNVS